MKLLVQIPQGYEPERRYILDVLLGEFLGLDFEVLPYDDRMVRIIGGDGKECQIVDGLFSCAEADWLTPRSLPASRLKWWDSSALPFSPKQVDSMALKVFKRSKLVYDTHELETETVAAHGIRKHLSKILERVLIRFVDETIVVNDSIAQWYKQEYRLKRVWVVRNVPYNAGENITKTRMLREAFGIRDEEIVYLFTGGISQGRGIPLLLDAFSRTHPNRHVVFMGFDHLTSLVQEYAAKYPNIHHHPAVPSSDVLKYAAGADVGLCLYENTCLNHYLCLPNKVFEYMLAGLPMIVSDFPEMAALVERYDCGWKVAVDVEALLALVETISLKEVRAKSANACGARGHFGWHLEEPTLLEVYRQMLGPQVSVRVPEAYGAIRSIG